MMRNCTAFPIDGEPELMQPVSHNSQRGFTFVEVLVAMLFVAIVIPVALQGIALASKAGNIADRKMTASILAEKKLNEIIITEEWDTGENQGTFGEEWPEYSWQLISETWNVDAMTIITVVASFEVQEREYSVEISALVDDSEEEE
jgi:general secretion pathway protein I